MKRLSVGERPLHALTHAARQIHTPRRHTYCGKLAIRYEAHDGWHTGKNVLAVTLDASQATCLKCLKNMPHRLKEPNDGQRSKPRWSGLPISAAQMVQAQRSIRNL